MSVLETAVAVRHDSVDDLVDVMLSIIRAAGHRAEVRGHDAPPSPHPQYDIRVGPATSGWVTLHPHYVIVADGLALALTQRLSAVASATSIYEDVLWTHDLVDSGRILDRYVNLPGYFGPGEYGPEHEGKPDLVAQTLGVDATTVAPYFKQVSVRRARSRLLPPPKAHADDHHHLLDGWVITDLWRRCGITWGGDAPAARILLDHDGLDALSEHVRALAH